MALQIVISNVYADDNRGGAAITAATIAAARRAFPDPAISLVAVSGGSEERMQRSFRHTSREHPELEVLSPLVEIASGRLAGLRALLRSLGILLLPHRLLRGNPALQRILEADLVIGKGGQMLSARSLRGTVGLWLAALPLVLAARLRKPTVLYSVTVGPFPRPGADRWMTKLILKAVRLVMVRDRDSYDAARHLKLPSSRLMLMPDCVMTMAPPEQERIDAMASRYDLSLGSYACITMNRPGTEGEQEYMVEVVHRLLDAGLVERLLLVLQTDGDLKSDAVASRRFMTAVADERLQFVSDDLDWAELCALYAGGLFTIGGRVHSTIFSLLSSTPAFPIQRAGLLKARSIFESFGLGDNVIDFSDPPRAVIEHIQEVVCGDLASFASLVSRLRNQARTSSTEGLRRAVTGSTKCMVIPSVPGSTGSTGYEKS